jgi:hypothetical protein
MSKTFFSKPFTQQQAIAEAAVKVLRSDRLHC